jgi:hypothetical protein
MALLLQRLAKGYGSLQGYSPTTEETGVGTLPESEAANWSGDYRRGPRGQPG